MIVAVQRGHAVMDHVNTPETGSILATVKKTKQTRKKAATNAALVLNNPDATKAAKSAAASALSQTGRAASTGKKAASALAQAPRKKKK